MSGGVERAALVGTIARPHAFDPRYVDPDPTYDADSDTVTFHYLCRCGQRADHPLHTEPPARP